jgi:hypothetical protein
MTEADLARVRAELFGEELPEPEAEVEVELVEADMEIDPEPPPPPPADPLAAIRRRIAAHDYGGAIVLAEGVLSEDPGNDAARRYLDACQTTLANIYVTQLGGGACVLKIAMPPSELRQLTLDRWGGFIMSRVDSESTIDDIIDISGMPRLDVLRILYELLQQGVIGG